MSSIVLLADTHGNLSSFPQLVSVLSEADYIVHAGDGIADVAKYPNAITVCGNNDGGGASEKVIEIDGIRILLTHGHKYDVKKAFFLIAERARELKVKYVFYGHTHVPDVFRLVDDVTLINPGSLRAGKASYCYINTYRGRLLIKTVNCR